MIILQKFNNLVQLFTYFNNEQVCRDYLEQIRWNGNITCPYEDCKHDKVFKYSNGKVYKCDKCKKQFSVRVGTMFEGSKISLQKWFAAIYLITSHKHLQRYVDEFVFRYNTRVFSESYRFDYVLNNINNRLTYKELKNVRSN